MTLNKKILTVFSLVILLFALCVGCTNKSKQVEMPQETMKLSAVDTTQVLDLVQQYFDLLLKKDFEGAMSMLSQLRGGSLQEMSPEMRKHYEVGMKIITPIRYELENIVFKTEEDCLVRYSGILFEKEDPTDKRPNKVYYAVKPVRINGEWHLTVADVDDQNTKESEIKI